MELQRVMSLTRKAIDEYSLIEDGDKIAIGISGGKDSMALLYALNGLSKFYPKKFEIEAITIDLGFDGLDTESIRTICNELGVNYTVVKTEISRIIFEERKESNPCSLCAKMRKGALNSKIQEMGCNKVAYAHHKDDVIETLLMSMIYEGRIQTFSPATYLEKTGITVIRPFLYMNEVDIIGFKNKVNFPVSKKICPADGNTKREYVKNIIKRLNNDNPGVKDRLFTSVVNSNLDGWTKSE